MSGHKQYQYEVHSTDSQLGKGVLWHKTLNEALKDIHMKQKLTNIELHVIDGDEVVRGYTFEGGDFWHICSDEMTKVGIIHSLGELNSQYKALVDKLEQEVETYQVTGNNENSALDDSNLKAVLRFIYYSATGGNTDIKLSILKDGVVNRWYWYSSVYESNEYFWRGTDGTKPVSKKSTVEECNDLDRMYAEIIKKAEGEEGQLTGVDLSDALDKALEHQNELNQTTIKQESQMSITLKNKTQSAIDQNVSIINTAVSELESTMKHTDKPNPKFHARVILEVSYDHVVTNEDTGKVTTSRERSKFTNLNLVEDIPVGDFKAFANNILGRYRSHMAAAKQAQKDLTIIKIEKF